MKTRSIDALPSPVRDAVAQLGRNVRIARQRRRMSMRTFAERAMIGVATLQRLERGDPTVGVGIIASALWVLDLHAHVSEVAAPDRDRIGKQLEVEHLPKRVRQSTEHRDF